MANEYLQRTPTSTGNRRVFTISFWVKRSTFSTTTPKYIFSTGTGTAEDTWFSVAFDSDGVSYDTLSSGTWTTQVTGAANFYIRDPASWMHILVAVNTTQIQATDRGILYINGVRVRTNTPTVTRNASLAENNGGIIHYIGARTDSGPRQYFDGELTDVFLVDGQALTPDVFGFYKQGKGYISAGSTQATDFRPGQWVPKTPRVIKTEINRRGGFGVNGFYLPMNDYRNFGADFHGDPNSIITLNEKLPQPRVGVASTAAVGLGYTDVLRADPYAANLVLALPFVSSGLCTNGTNVGVNTGFGDYSHIIRGSGSVKSITNTGVSIASTASYYGSGSYFDSGNYLSTPNVSDFQFGTGDFTIEAWAYSFSGSWSIIAAQGTTGDAGRTLFGISNAGAINTQIGSQSLSSSAGIATSAQWNHVALVRKNGVGTIYLNGVCVGINTVYTNSIQNTTLYVGSDQGWTNTSSKMYLQDLRVYKGVAKYTGGFDVPRPYTPVGIATWRQVPDTTANNFATQQPTNGSSLQTLTAGNLNQLAASGGWNTVRGSIGITTGKYYWEVIMSGSANTIMVGVDDNAYQVQTNPSSFYVGSYGNSWSLYFSGGQIRNNTTTGSAYGSSLSTGDICMVAADITNGKIYWGKNGTWFNSGNPATGTNAAYTNLSGYSQIMPAISCFDSNSSVSINFGQNPTFSGNTTAGTFTDSNGKGLFKYQPPSGFLALCEDNLPTPAISDPGKYFKTVLYTGDGASGRSIVGVGFTPDLVWYKARSSAFGNGLFDSVRGIFRLSSDGTGAENTDQGVISFNSDGFSLGNHASGNTSGTTMVAWCWRAGAGTTSTNTNGSITSVVSVNQDAGFSIVSFTGTGAQGTFGHGLGKTPKFILMKRRTGGTNNWSVYHSSLGLSHTTYPNWLYLNATSVEQSSVSSANHPLYQRPDSNLIYLNTGTSESTNVSGSTYIAYCWAEIESFSKFGSYVGNGNADGPFVYCGFKPAWILIKKTDGSTNWVLEDSTRNSTNPAFSLLQPNTTAVEDNGSSSLTSIDFLSNGFKIRGNWADNNSNGSPCIFAAFSESPFQTANAK